LPDNKTNLIEELIFILNAVNTDDFFVILKLTGCIKIDTGIGLDLGAFSVVSVNKIKFFDCGVFFGRPIYLLDREFKITSLHVFLFDT